MSTSSKHGGYRSGAGRKPQSGAFGEPTQPLRIPQSRVEIVRAYLDACRAGEADSADAPTLLLAKPSRLAGTLPLIGRVAAGNPILAEAHIERYVIVDPTLFRPRPDFLLRVAGDSMCDVGILDRDLIAVHRTSEAQPGQIVVARIDGEVTVKRLQRVRRRVVLLPENANYAPIEVDPRSEFGIEGVFVGVIRTT